MCFPCGCATIRLTGTTSGSRRRVSGSWQRFLSGRRGSWTTLGRRKSRWRGFLTREVLTQNGVTMLKGWAYMLRGAETDGLIRQIEGGIKKEVSIGCTVRRKMCSICGEEYGACGHVKGETYGAERCAAILCEAADAYEFSFVAVPAQKEAGVLKKQTGGEYGA